MSTANLEQRVSALETRCSELWKIVHDQPSTGAWRKVVGMFADDPEIDLLHQETRRIREEDRQASRGRSEGDS